MPDRAVALAFGPGEVLVNNLGYPGPADDTVLVMTTDVFFG